MKISRQICLLLLVLSLVKNLKAQAQDSTWCSKVKHGVGLQLNPYINERFLTPSYRRINYAARHKLMHPTGYSFGPEISGHWLKVEGEIFKNSYFIVNFGGFARYAVLRKRAVSPFLEASLYFGADKSNVVYKILKDKSTTSQYYIGSYGAFGLAINLYKRKWFLDLLFKADYTKPLKYNEWHTYYNPSFRLNYHF